MTFEEFWQLYPRKTGKLAAARRWAQLKPDAETCIQIAATLQWQIHEWDDPQFIPHPATWLHQGRWMDEPPTMRTRTTTEKVVDANAAVVRELLGPSTLPKSLPTATPLRRLK